MEEESISMNRYFSESIFEHPVVKRLHQRVLELEKENEELKDDLSKQLVEVRRLENWYEGAQSSSKEWLDRATEAEAGFLKKTREVECLKKQLKEFNNLSPIQKMFYHFDI